MVYTMRKRLISTHIFVTVTCSLIKIFVKARNWVTTKPILPATAERGITKLVCEIVTIITDGR